VKAVLQYRASAGFLAELARQADEAGVEAVAVDESDEAAYVREIGDAEVLLHVLKPVTAAMMDQAPRLKLVQKLGVGVNTIDLEAARARGVAVANMPGVNSQAVAEMTLALMLATLRRLTYFDPLVRAGEGWRPDLAVLDTVGEIAGRTVGPRPSRPWAPRSSSPPGPPSRMPWASRAAWTICSRAPTSCPCMSP
jgi:phosphoglycerate dehydrogenase-like enzyme